MYNTLGKLEWFWCNEKDSQVDKCIGTVEEFEWIGCNEQDSQVEK